MDGVSDDVEEAELVSEADDVCVPEGVSVSEVSSLRAPPPSRPAA